MGVNVSRGDACGGRKKLQNNKNIIASTEVIVSSHTNMNPNELKRRNKEIEAEILRDQKANARVIKLLLLGTAECGKSTILKQMRILHSAGFSDSEVRLQKCSIFENILNSIVTLIEAVQNEKLLFSSEDLQLPNFDMFSKPGKRSFSDFLPAVRTGALIEAQMMCKLKQSNTDRNCLLSPQTLLTIKRLWIEDSIQKIFADSSDYHLPDSTK
uniref:Uncharacterized protein n=1 Tax=Romanomermis culicivorax TaxID=13658 RepID=A0A915KHP2_ROMCU